MGIFVYLFVPPSFNNVCKASKNIGTNFEGQQSKLNLKKKIRKLRSQPIYSVKNTKRFNLIRTLIFNHIFNNNECILITFQSNVHCFLWNVMTIFKGLEEHGNLIGDFVCNVIYILKHRAFNLELIVCEYSSLVPLVWR